VSYIALAAVSIALIAVGIGLIRYSNHAGRRP